MKNLKKVLALVLAFACAFTMFAGAAFSDQADIQSTEAVDALTGLGVIQGYTDGSFRPDVTVTRAEMAKMIFTILNGGNDDASAYENLPTSFTDLTDNWYKGYIKYLQNSGIIAGKSATRFAPNETVTGVEAAKMLLVVAGYDADKAGLTGLSWMANTMKYANLNNLFEDVDADVNAGLPRQYAAQIMYNALDMERVVYSNDINDFKPATDVQDEATIGAKYLDLKFAGKHADEPVYLTGSEKEANRDTYSLTVSEYNDKSADLVSGTYTRVANDYSDLVGHRVVIMYKDGQHNEVYGVYAYEDSTVVASGYVGQLETVTSDDYKIKLDGTEYKLNAKAADTTVYTVNDDVSARKSLSALAGMAKKNLDADQDNVARSIKLIDTDGDGKVDSVISNEVEFGKVTYVGTTSMSVGSGVGSLKFDETSGYEDIKKDDYVFVTREEQNSSDKDVVVKADVTSATIEATRNGTGANSSKVAEARVDGTWYRVAQGVNITSGSSYDLILCGNYILAADETAGSIEEVALLAGVDSVLSGRSYTVKVETGVGAVSKEGTVKARLYFGDSSNEEIKISRYDGDKLVASGDGEGQVVASTVLDAFLNTSTGDGVPGLVTYSKLSDGTYDVKKVDNNNLAGCDALTSVGTKTVTDSKIDGMLVNDDAVIFVKANTEIKVVSGSTVKNWKDNTALATGSVVLTETNNGLPYVAAGYLVVSSEKVPGATNDTQYGYLTRDAYTVDTADGKKATFEVWTAEGTQTLTADNSATHGLKTGDLMSYTVNGNYIDDVAKVGVEAAIIGTNNEVEGVATLTTGDNTSKTYSFDEDCVFVAIDDDASEGREGGVESIQTAEPIDNAPADGTVDAYVANAYVVINSDGKIVAVFFDVNNKLDSEAHLAVR